MKGIFLIVLVMLSNLVILNRANAKGPLPEKDEGLLGEIRMSLLTEPEFQSIYGTDWELMRGQPIEKSDLALTFPEWKALPDARGLFLRGHNNARNPAEGNPENQALGVLQKESFLSHTHKINRSHGDANPSCLRIQTPLHGSAGGHTECADDILKIGPAGGNETRPKNLTVNIFIKINRTKEDRATNAILEEIQSLPQYFIKNRALMKVLDNYINVAVDQRLAKLHK
ncbi:MAG: hypothetical protein ABIQ95_02925 [Bdellovibrionia bacterium]